MNKQQRANAIEEHAKKLREENEVQYLEALKEVPAMPILYNVSKERRDRIKTLYNNKLHQVVDEMYAAVAKVLSPKEIASSPEAQAAMDKEWKKLVDKGCWVEKKSGAPHQSKAPPSEFLEVRGAPSIQDPTLELQDLKKF